MHSILDVSICLTKMAEINFLPAFMDRSRNYSASSRNHPGGDTHDIFGIEKRQRERKELSYGKISVKNVAMSGKSFSNFKQFKLLILNLVVILIE